MNPIVFVAAGGVAVGVFIGIAVSAYFLRGRKFDAEHIMALAKEKFSTDKEEIKIDLEGKKDAIKTLVDEIRKQLKETDEKLRQSDKERIDSFSKYRGFVDEFLSLVAVAPKTIRRHQ